MIQTTIKGINLEEEEAAGQEEGTSRVIEKDVELLASLKWSDTDNFYMNLGCHKGIRIERNLQHHIFYTIKSKQHLEFHFHKCHFEKGKGLICCGDDKGSLWLYHQPQFGKDSAKSLPSGKSIPPTTRLMWPELQDDHLENSRKVPLGKP